MGKETSNTLQTEELRAKEERKKRIRKLNEPPKLSLLEEVGNSITHGIGAGLAIAGMILLLVKSDTGLKVMAALFYGISLFLMMLMSCLYHAFKGGSTVKYVFRRFDYSSIYLLIGGTFAGKCIGHCFVLRPVGVDCIRDYDGRCVWTGKMAAAALHLIFCDRMERTDVPADVVPQ